MSAYNTSGGVFYCHNDATSKVPFYQCLLDLLSDNSLKGQNYVANVAHSFDKDSNLLLWKEEGRGQKLFHPPDCPLLKHAHLTDKNMSCKDNNIAIGAAVLLKSLDGFILLSRRAKTLRTFPGVWVPAGGHTEKGESLAETAIRELGEEVGIKFTSVDKFCIDPLCLFESCFPPFIEWGQPKRRHVVQYFVIQSTLSKAELNLRVELYEPEVDACIWLPVTAIKALLDKDVSNIPNNIEMMTIQNGVFQNNLHIHPTLFTNQVSGDDNSDIERFSTGTLIALRSLIEDV